VNVCVGRVRPTARVTVDPLQPVLGTMACREVLEIIGSGNALGFRGAKEVPSNRIGVVPERYLDGALKAM